MYVDVIIVEDNGKLPHSSVCWGSLIMVNRLVVQLILIEEPTNYRVNELINGYVYKPELLKFKS